MAFLPGQKELTQDIVLTRAEFWHLGFGPIAIAFAGLIVGGAFGIRRGSLIWTRFDEIWLILLVSAYGLLGLYHYGLGWGRELSIGFVSGLV